MMKTTKRLLALLLVMAMVIVNVPAPVFAVGTTNADGYIEVRTVEDLYFVRNDLTAKYILMNDIDLTEATKAGGDWDYMGNGWNPIGSNDIYASGKFSGIFDGNGHKITGLRIDVTKYPSGINALNYVGLFSNVSGTVKNLTVEGSCHVKGALSYYVGGIAACVSGTVTNCVSNVDVYVETAGSDAFVGGIAGFFSTAAISNCVNNGEITAYTDAGSVYVGGIVGRNTSTSGTIKKCYNTGLVSVSVRGYYSNGSNYAYGYANGIGSNGTMSDCYNTGEVKAYLAPTGTASYSSGYAHGIGGWKSIRCYNVGTVTGVNVRYAIASSGCSNCYYLEGVGTQSTGTTPLTAAQAKIQNMYSGFDFTDTWIMNPYAEYPYPQLRSNLQGMDEGASLVSILSQPTKQKYFTGDALDLTGGMIRVVYASGTEDLLNMTADMISGYDPDTVGVQTLTVTVNGASDTFTVEVVKRPVVKEVKMLFQPDQKVFTVGTAFDFTGAQIKVTYEGGAIEYMAVTADMTSGGNIHHIGKQTITVTYKGCSDTFEVEVVGIALANIRLERLPDQLTYLEGQPLDLTGMVIMAVMNNGMENAITTGYTVSGYSDEPGTHTVTVAYQNYSVGFTVTVLEKTIVSLTLNTLPDKLEYVSGQAFDGTGMELLATFNNGEVVPVTEYTVSGFDSTVGIKNVVLSAYGKSVTFPVKVTTRVITNVQLVSKPSKLEYIAFETMDLSGLKLEATYNDDSTEEVTDYSVAGFSSNPGVHTVSVTYAGFVQSFTITVLPRELENIVVTAPAKTAYSLGEAFDAQGLTVLACYNNGQEIPVSDYVISGFDSTTAGVKTVTVTYGGISRSFVVVISERSQVEIDGSFAVSNVVARLGEEVRVPVSVTGNVGIVGLRHEISFHATDLKFVGVELLDNYAAGSVVVNTENAQQGKVTLVWFHDTNVTDNGDVYELIFQVQETAVDGTTEVQIDFADNDNGNVSGENLIFGKQDGSVEVRSYWLGDLNGDRKFAMVDLVMLAQYVAGFDMTMTDKQLLSADVNEDGNIDIHDVILLNQWLLAEDF